MFAIKLILEMTRRPNRMMAEHRLLIYLRGGPRDMIPTVTAGPVPLTTHQCCTHCLGVKLVQINACPCQAANCPCTSSCPSEKLPQTGPYRAPTAPRLTTNVSQNIEEVQESALTLSQATPRLSSNNMHRCSHPLSSQEETFGLPYRRAPRLPTCPQCSPIPPPPTPPHRQPLGPEK